MGSFPAVVAEHSPNDDLVRVCMRVENAVGWPLANVQVTPIRVAFGTGLGPGAAKTTDAEGDVAFDLPISDFQLAFRDLEGPLSPARNGVAYMPQADNAVEVRIRHVVHGGCADGSDGMPYRSGVVRLATSPAQGFLQLNIMDQVGRIPPGSTLPPGLAGAHVLVVPVLHASAAVVVPGQPAPPAMPVPPTITPDADETAAYAIADQNGVVRMACIVSAPNQLVVAKDGWLRTPIEPPCAATGLSTVDVGVWRTPVLVEAQIQQVMPGLVPTPGPLSTGTLDVVSVDDHDEEIAPAINRALATDLALCADSGTARVRLINNPQPLPPRVEVDVRENNVTGAAATPYICHARADDAGRAILRLPWTSEHAFDLKAAAPGFGPVLTTAHVHIQDTGPRAPDAAQPTLVRAPGLVLLEAITLSRQTTTLTGNVRDLSGAPVIGATLDFGSDITATSAEPNGAFSAPGLTTGTRSVTITADGFADRSCMFNLDVDENGNAIPGTPDPDYCYTLVKAGKVGVRATLVDGEIATAALPAGVQVCGANARCGLTSAAGTIAFEVDAAVSNDIIPTADQPWSAFETAQNIASAVAAGSIVDLGTKELARKQAPLVVRVQKLDGTPIAGASLTLALGGTIINQPAPANATDADGNNLGAWTTGGKPVWTKYDALNTHPRFDLAANYVATANKYLGTGTNDVMYDYKAAAAFDLFGVDLARTIPITLDPATGAFSISVTSMDQNRGNTTASIVRAGIVLVVDDPRDPSLAIGPTSVVTTPGALVLYKQNGPYRACADATDWYLASSTAAGGNTTCPAGIVPGTTESIALQVRRKTATIRLTAVDAHTTWPLAGYQTRAVSPAGTLKCATPARPMCWGNTSWTPPYATDTGALNTHMEVPWTDNANDICIRGLPTKYQAMWNAQVNHAQAPNVTGESSLYQEALVCKVWAPSTTYDHELRPLRAAIGPLQGRVTDFLGVNVADAVVTLRSDRGAFTCDPIKHNSTTTFPACGGLPVLNGAFSFMAPSAGANSTWNVTVTAPGYYEESFNLWPNQALVSPDFKLYPRSFDVTVRIRDTGALISHACGADPERKVFVALRDLQSETPTADALRVRALPHPDGTCVATFTLNEWHRDPRPMPAPLNLPWPKTASPFLVLADQDGHAGANVSLLGPDPANRVVDITMVHPTFPSTGPGSGASIRGRVYDGDGLSGITSVLGVPSIVTAVGTTPGCTGSASALTDAQGAYTINAPCVGTYTVSAKPLDGVATFWTARSSETTLSTGDPTETLDLALARTTGTLTVFIQGTCTTIDPTPIDSATDVAARACGPVASRFIGVHWGAYTLTPSRAGTPGPATPAFVRPGAETEAVVVSP